MEMLLDTWQDINPGAVTFPDVNTTGTKIQIRVPSSVTPKGTPYCPGKELRYAWEDFPECAIYNTDGLPLPPFNVKPRINGFCPQGSRYGASTCSFPFILPPLRS